MKKSTVISAILVLCLLTFIASGCSKRTETAKTQTIKIGFNIPLTGESPKIGADAQKTAELVKKRVNDAGGLQVGDKKYPVEFIYVDNEKKPESAVQAASRLTEQDKVLALVGPAGSGRAIPAAEVANDLHIPMVSPWATNPQVTIGRPYVFRACILDPVQATAAVSFTRQTFPAVSKIAVLYNNEDDYSKGLAEFFRDKWIEAGGSIVAFESHSEMDKDFSVQLTKIIASDADMLYLPVYYNHVAMIIPQAKNLGWGDKPILGSDSWGNADLVPLSNGAVKGYFYTTHFAMAGATGTAKQYIDDFKAAYNSMPDEISALFFDATNLTLDAIQRAGLTWDLAKDRENIKNALAATKNYPGITSDISFDANGDPADKFAVVVRVNDAGESEYVASMR